jgi:signal peptidase II
MLTALTNRFTSLTDDDTIRRYSTVAVMSALSDGVSKVIAVRTLSDDNIVTLSDRLALVLVWNHGAAGGVSLGPYTAIISVVVTVMALVLVGMVVRQISAIDPRAAVALGLVTGGALGNLASIIGGPRGVADFIGLRLWNDYTLIANVADLFLWSGALMLIPVVRTLLRKMRSEGLTV